MSECHFCKDPGPYPAALDPYDAALGFESMKSMCPYDYAHRSSQAVLVKLNSYQHLSSPFFAGRDPEREAVQETAMDKARDEARDG